jgi:hypothetical protein
MHGEFLRLLFLQAHRETEAHFTATGMSSQTNNSEALRFKCAAFADRTDVLRAGCICAVRAGCSCKRRQCHAFDGGILRVVVTF